MRKLLLNLQTFDDGASAGTSAGEGTTAENTQGVATPTVKGRKGLETDRRRKDSHNKRNRGKIRTV